MIEGDEEPSCSPTDSAWKGSPLFDFEREIGRTRRAALQVLLNNAREGRGGLPRAAAWGYKEPYTRDLMIGSLGVLASGNEELAHSLNSTLTSLARHQRKDGALPRICDESGDFRASDTTLPEQLSTPLFLIGLAAYRQIARAPNFLEDAGERALLFCDSQYPLDKIPLGRELTREPPDEQQVPGHELLARTLLYSALVLFGQSERAESLRKEIDSPVGHREPVDRKDDDTVPTGDNALVCPPRGQVHRFDLLANSIAILSGALSREKSVDIIQWLELTCEEMRSSGQLTTRCPPSLLPPHESNNCVLSARTSGDNGPGEYRGGEVWPFVCGFYVAALVAVGQLALAQEQLLALTELCGKKKNDHLEFGFNEWIRASDGSACGEDWQNWSASMYLYAASCVESGRTPLFDAVRFRTQRR